MKRAATYARFSTDKQTETSIDDQRRACNEYAKQNGLQVVHEFADLAISGASFGNRPGVIQLQKAAFAGEIDVIVIADLTRLSRNSADLPKFLERMRFRGVRVIGVLDRFDSDQRHSRMQAGLSGIMSDEYRAAVGERVHLALDTLAKNSKSTGGVAYGYTSTRVKVPDQARIVKEIFRRIAGGETMKAVVSDLNARGVPSPGSAWKRSSNRRDGRWIVAALNALLQNEIYMGRVIWNRSQWVKEPDTGIRKRRERPKSEWVIDERPELALVDRPTWDTVHKRMQDRKVGRLSPQARNRYPLSGLLECKICRGSFVMSGGGKNSRGYGRAGPRYYVCSTFHHGGANACTNAIRVERELVEDMLVQPALDELLSEAAVNAAVIRIKHAMKDTPPVPVVDLTAIEAKIAKIRAHVASGVLEAEDAEPVFVKLEAERAALVREAQRVVRGPLISGPWGVEAEYRKQAQQMREDLTGEDADAARAALVAAYGPRIPLRPDPTGRFLIAETVLQANVVLLASGSNLGRIRESSGGPLCAHIPLIRRGQK